MTTRVKGSSFNTLDNMGYISLADVGVGDGVTDNTAAITTVLATGKPIFIPVGTFLTGALVIPAGSIILGTGNGSIIKLKNTSNAIALTVGSTSTLSNFQLDCNKGNQVGSNLHGIQFSNATGSGAYSVTVINCKGDGINITGTSTDTVMLNTCTVTGFARNGITIDSGVNISLLGCTATLSDVTASPGDGIAIVSAVNPVSRVVINGCTSKNNVGRGLAIVGNATKNVKNVAIATTLITNNTGHGLHLLLTEKIVVSTSVITLNAGDGVRLEGDTQNSRISGLTVESNTGFGMREIVAGSTPNLNGLIYNVVLSNGNDTITKVGAGSFIV